MLSALTQLLIFQLAGEVTARGFNLPVPGPVLGMLFLFIALMIKGGPGKELQGTSQTLLQHLSLLFVPAGTGVMLHLQLPPPRAACLIRRLGQPLQHPRIHPRRGGLDVCVPPQVLRQELVYPPPPRHHVTLHMKLCQRAPATG